jgi:DNA-binding CsgD family transcriptional regulator
MRFSLLLSLLFLSTCAFCTGVFEPVRSLPPALRMAQTQQIYDNGVKHKDSVFAIASLQALVTMANELDDKTLQCFSVSLLADQYARIRGANGYSEGLHLQSIRMAEKARLPLMTGFCNYRTGRYYYSFKNYPFAFEYLLKADNLFTDIGYKEVPDVDEFLFFLGSIYYETGNYDKAEIFLQSIQKLAKIGGYFRKQSLNTLALISKQKNDTTAALFYFHKTLDAAIEQKDSSWIGISYSNIGSLYYSGQQYDKAYPLLDTGYRYCFIRKQWPDAYSDLLFMARIDLSRNRMAEALDKINRSIALHPFFYTLTGRKNLYETQALYYDKTQQQSALLNVQKKLLQLKDSLSLKSDEQTYRKIQLRMESEWHLSQIDKLEAAAHESIVKQNAVIAVLVLLVIVLLLLYNRYRLRARNAASEKQYAEEKLKYARQLLQNFTENNRQKNELIEQFSIELQRLKSNMAGDPLQAERLNNFEKLVQSTILTDTEWKNFRELFNKVHKGFFTRIEKKLPGLSLEEIRLVSLIRLGLSNLEIGNMMGIQADAVQAAKQKLLHKIHPVNDGITIEGLVLAI